MINNLFRCPKVFTSETKLTKVDETRHKQLNFRIRSKGMEQYDCTYRFVNLISLSNNLLTSHQNSR